MKKKRKVVAVIGLGYVGLPLAVEFSKVYPTFGYDINDERVQQIKKGEDITLEVSSEDLKYVLENDSDFPQSKGLICTSSLHDIEAANFYVITVPTPIDKNNSAVLVPLLNASRVVGKILNKGDYVIYESTVYPGATEDECVPILESESGLVFNEDFFVGYSPERINPGDKKRTVSKITKVTSGSTKEAALVIDNLYKSIITAGTYIAPSIQVAEAAKVIENCQRDINIAFVNELAKIFSKLGIDTQEVLDAASTKWNFLQFKPGLVGGHCIGVDPYYLAQKAQEVGYHPEIILSGRRLNDGMATFVVNEVIKLMLKKALPIINSDILILGITFKENCPDTRNSKSFDVYRELKSFGVNVDVYDPWASTNQVFKDFGLQTLPSIRKKYHAIILLVGHDEFKNFRYSNYLHANGVLYDVKSFYPKSEVSGRL